MADHTTEEPAPSWKVVPSPREKETDGDDVWLWVEYKNLPVDAKGHQFTGSHGNGTVDGTIVLTSKYDINQFSAHNTFSCQQCDAYPGFEFYDDPEHGPRLVYVDRISRPPKDDITCPCPDGVEWSFELAVPSGKMIVSDDLRPVYNVEFTYAPDEPDYCSDLGQQHHSLRHAAIGCAYGPTSNIGLGLYRVTNEQDRYAVVTPDYDDEDKEALPFEGVKVANICTDLWAYSIADFEHFVARARDLVASADYEEYDCWADWRLGEWLAAGADPADLPSDYEIVDVTPGTYRFTHHGARPGFTDGPWPLTWASIERVS